MPALSPTLNLVTPEPTAETMPTISWPGTMGYLALPHSLRTWWMSEWQMPEYLMSMTISSSLGARRSKVKGSRGLDASVAAYPFAKAMDDSFVCNSDPDADGAGHMTMQRKTHQSM